MTTTISRIEDLNGGIAQKVPCRVATTGNIVLNGLISVDGVSLNESDRVLVWQQTDASENGIYNPSTGAWIRAKDFNGAKDIVKGTEVRVTDGQTYGGDIFYVTTNNPITIGSSAINFARVDIGNFNVAAPTTTLGDIIYHDGNGNNRLTGNTTTTRKFLSQTGNGTVSASPEWNAISANDLPTTSIAKGGTGETVKSAAFDALAPTTTKGDIVVHNGTDNVRQAIGSDGAVLVADSSSATGVSWDTVSGGSGVFNDSSFRVQNSTDSTKKIAFNASGIASGNTRTFSVPDQNDTIVGATSPQTMTNKTLLQPNIDKIKNVGTLNLPNINTTLVGNNTTDTLTNKTLTSPTINGGVGNFSDLQVGGIDAVAANQAAATVHGGLYGLEYSTTSGAFALDLIVDTGEVNTASNVGSGAQVFKQKTGVNLEMRTIVAGSNITVSGGTNEITITGGTGSTAALDDLTDVTTAGATVHGGNYALEYSSISGGYSLESVTGSFGGSYADLSDITTTPITNGNAYRFIFNGTDRLQFESDAGEFNYANIVSSKIANDSTAPSGFVGNNVLVTTTATATSINNEWGLTSIFNNYAPLGGGLGASGENAAGYFQINHYNAGSSWAAAFESNDKNNGGLGGILWGTETLVRTSRTNSGGNLVVSTLLTRNDTPGTAGRIYAFSLSDSAVEAPSNTSQYGYLVGDKEARLAAHGGAKPTVQNAFAVFADGTTGFQDEGNKVVGLNLGGSYSGNAIRIPASSTIAFEQTGSVFVGWNSSFISFSRGLEVNGASGGAHFKGIGSASWGVDLQSASMSSGVLRSPAIDIKSNGTLDLKLALSNGTYTNGGSTKYFGGVGVVGRFWRISLEGRGTDAFIPIYVENTGNTI